MAYKKIIIPCNKKAVGHWFVWVVDMEKCEIEVFDSLSGTGTRSNDSDTDIQVCLIAI